LKLKPRHKIKKNTWLTQNRLYLQFGLFYLGLNFRILFVNAAGPALGLFLLFTILSAITIVYLYGGRSWCHYVCPFGMVQMVFTGPRGLFGTKAHEAPPRSITQSMCRTFNSKTGRDKINCTGCNSGCMDIDSEKAYWHHLKKPGRKLVQYGYLGLVIGYIIYYRLYAGNWDYYFSGAWTHEANQLSTIFNPGFYILNQPIAIPKLIAAPLTLAAFAAIAYFICIKIEKQIFSYLKRKDPGISHELVLHGVFTICSFIAFNAFFIYGGRPELMRLPAPLQQAWQCLIVLVSTLWLDRTWGRNAELYRRESLASKLRGQLKKLVQKLQIDLTKLLECRSLPQLKPDELYLLVKVLPNATKQDRLQVYKGAIKEVFETGTIKTNSSFKIIQQVREQLEINDEEHNAVLTEVNIEDPILLDPHQNLGYENQLRIESYRKALEWQVWDLFQSGIPLFQVLELKSSQIIALKRDYSITQQESDRIFAKMLDSHGELKRKSTALLAQLQLWTARYQTLKYQVSHHEATVLALLRSLLQPKLKLITEQLLSILEIQGVTPEAINLAQGLTVLANPLLPEILQHRASKWQQRLSPKVIALLKANCDSTQVCHVSMHSEGIIDVLKTLLQEPNPLTQAASLYALYRLDVRQGREQAQYILSSQFQNDLLQETAENILKEIGLEGTIEKLLQLLETDFFKSIATLKIRLKNN